MGKSCVTYLLTDSFQSKVYMKYSDRSGWQVAGARERAIEREREGERGRERKREREREGERE